METALGWLCVLPVALVMALAFVTRNAVAALFVGAVCGCLLLTGFAPGETYRLLLEVTLSALQNRDFAWLIVLMSLFGALVALLQKSGGVLGFARWFGRRVRTRRGALLATWLLGLIVFVDDYLNNLTVGTVMQDVTDRHGISRQMLAFSVNSMGAAVCAVLPVSSWGAFMMAQMEAAGVGDGSVLSAFLRTTPLMFYPWLVILLLPLTAFGIVPLFGAMRDAERDAQEKKTAAASAAAAESESGHAINFILPLLVASVSTAATGDMILSILLAAAAAAALSAAQHRQTPGGVLATVMGGMADMFPMMVLMCASYVLMEVNARLGFTAFMVDHAVRLIAPQWFAAGTFALVSLLSFGTGTFWGIAVVVFPVLLPMARALGADVYLTTAAIISGCVVGSHLCFYGDTVILACGTTKVNNVEYFRCAAPLCAAPLLLTLILYAAAGLAMGG